MKYYLIYMHNGEPYEDFYEWFEHKIYKTKEECIEVLKQDGFKWKGDKYSEYEKKIDQWQSNYANIIELEVME